MLKDLKVITVVNGSFNIPNGCRWYSIYNEGTSTYSMTDEFGVTISGIDVAFSTPEQFFIHSETPNPIIISTTGTILISYIV